jgi:hypothetical protein
MHEKHLSTNNRVASRLNRFTEPVNRFTTGSEFWLNWTDWTGFELVQWTGVNLVSFSCGVSIFLHMAEWKKPGQLSFSHHPRCRRLSHQYTPWLANMFLASTVASLQAEDELAAELQDFLTFRATGVGIDHNSLLPLQYWSRYARDFQIFSRLLQSFWFCNRLQRSRSEHSRWLK